MHEYMQPNVLPDRAYWPTSMERNIRNGELTFLSTSLLRVCKNKKEIVFGERSFA